MRVQKTAKAKIVRTDDIILINNYTPYCKFTRLKAFADGTPAKAFFYNISYNISA